jgi:hypothetical protein
MRKFLNSACSGDNLELCIFDGKEEICAIKHHAVKAYMVEVNLHAFLNLLLYGDEY